VVQQSGVIISYDMPLCVAALVLHDMRMRTKASVYPSHF